MFASDDAVFNLFVASDDAVFNLFVCLICSFTAQSIHSGHVKHTHVSYEHLI